MSKLWIVVLASALAVGCGKKDKNNVDGDVGSNQTDMGGPNNTVDMNANNINNNDPDMGGTVDMRRQPPTCAPYTAAAEFVDEDEIGLFYYADESDSYPTDSLGIELYDELREPGTYTLGDNYETCLECVLIYTDCDEEQCGAILLAKSGTLELTSVDGQLTGSLTDAQFEEVEIDEDFVSTPVPGGELRCVSDFSFDVPIPAGPQLPEICTDTSFTGQIGGAGVHDGGTYTDVPFANDAGLQAVWDAIPVAAADAVTDLTAAPVAVSGAIVTATDFDDNANWHFWVQDANVAMQVRLSDAAGTPSPVAMDVKVGQAVSFMVTMAETFSGHPQIKEITGFAIDSEGNDVYVAERFDADITAADYASIVRVGGVLGTPAACGGSNMCYPMTYGAASDKTVTFRSSSTIAMETSCAVFVGPVGGFPGPKDPGGIMTLQIDTANFSWMVVP